MTSIAFTFHPHYIPGGGDCHLTHFTQDEEPEAGRPVSRGGARFHTPASQGSACTYACFGFH